VSVRSLLDWSSAFMASDGPRLLATEGRQSVAAQARSLSDTLRCAAAAPQSAGLDRAIIAFDLQVVASQLGRISCLARAFDATDGDAQLRCSLGEHLDILVGGSGGLEAAPARSRNSLHDARPALMSIEAAASSTLVAAQQAQAPSTTVALINNCLVNTGTLEMDDAASEQAASKLLLSQQAASLAMSSALLGDDTYANVVLLRDLDALQQMLDGLRVDDVKSGTDAGVSCSTAQGFDCIAEKLTDGMLQLDAMHAANESSTCFGAATQAMVGVTQSDALWLAAQNLSAAQHAFDLVHPNPRTFVDARDYSAIALEYHSRWSRAAGDLFDAR
jgi:hypothetical protein